MEFNKEFFKKAYISYYKAKLEYNNYNNEMAILNNIENISNDETFTDIKDSIVIWLKNMANKGLIDENDSKSVELILDNAYSKLDSESIDSHLEFLDKEIKNKLQILKDSFHSIDDNKGYINKILWLHISGLKIDHVDIVNKIIEQEGVFLDNNSTNDNKGRKNFDTLIYADNKDVLKDIEDKLSIASVTHNFNRNIKILKLLNDDGVFDTLIDHSNKVAIGSHLKDIVKMDELIETLNQKS